jgi:hypothetical protein
MDFPGPVSALDSLDRWVSMSLGFAAATRRALSKMGDVCRREPAEGL